MVCNGVMIDLLVGDIVVCFDIKIGLFCEISCGGFWLVLVNGLWFVLIGVKMKDVLIWMLLVGEGVFYCLVMLMMVNLVEVKLFVGCSDSWVGFMLEVLVDGVMWKMIYVGECGMCDFDSFVLLFGLVVVICISDVYGLSGKLFVVVLVRFGYEVLCFLFVVMLLFVFSLGVSCDVVMG